MTPEQCLPNRKYGNTSASSESEGMLYGKVCSCRRGLQGLSVQQSEETTELSKSRDVQAKKLFDRCIDQLQQHRPAAANQ
jgi:hypothetical protein